MTPMKTIDLNLADFYSLFKSNRRRLFYITLAFLSVSALLLVVLDKEYEFIGLIQVGQVTDQLLTKRNQPVEEEDKIIAPFAELEDFIYAHYSSRQKLSNSGGYVYHLAQNVGPTKILLRLRLRAPNNEVAQKLIEQIEMDLESHYKQKYDLSSSILKGELEAVQKEIDKKSLDSKKIENISARTNSPYNILASQIESFYFKKKSSKLLQRRDELDTMISPNNTFPFRLVTPKMLADDPVFPNPKTFIFLAIGLAFVFYGLDTLFRVKRPHS